MGSLAMDARPELESVSRCPPRLMRTARQLVRRCDCPLPASSQRVGRDTQVAPHEIGHVGLACKAMLEGNLGNGAGLLPLQLDALHHERAVPAGRGAARPGWQLEQRTTRLGECSRSERVRRGGRTAPRLHPGPAPVPLRPVSRCRRAVQRRAGQRRRRHEHECRVRELRAGERDQQDLVWPDGQRHGAGPASTAGAIS